MKPDGLAARWVALWDQREAPSSLCAARILIGLVTLADLLWVRAVDGVSLSFAPPPLGLGYAALTRPPFTARWFGATETTALTLYAIALLATLAFTVGAAFRVAALVMAVALSQLAHFAPSGDRGIDSLLRMVVLLLALSAANARWSVDAWIRRLRGLSAVTEANSWPRLLLFGQVVWVYFSAAHNRADVAWWPMGGFSAVAVTWADPHYARFAPGWPPFMYALSQLATFSTMLFEITAPVLIAFTWLHRHEGRGGRFGEFVRRYNLRWVWLALGASLHLGIALTMRLGIFPFGMLAMYPLFLHPSELDAALGKLRARALRAQRSV